MTLYKPTNMSSDSLLSLPSDVIIKIIDSFDLEGLLVFLAMILLDGKSKNIILRSLFKIYIHYNPGDPNILFYTPIGVSLSIVCFNYSNYTKIMTRCYNSFTDLFEKLINDEKLEHSYDLIKIFFNDKYKSVISISELYETMNKIGLITFLKHYHNSISTSNEYVCKILDNYIDFLRENSMDSHFKKLK